MSKRMELYDDSMDGIVDQIQRTASGLNVKRKLLLNQIDLYKDLQAKIDMKAEKTMVLLGDGYFVEMSPKDAKDYLKRRITNVNDIVEGFNTKIRDAENTMDHISKFREIETKNGKKESNNEEGLPFFDIQEELDDEDNILSVKINNKSQTFEKSKSNKEEQVDEGLPMMDIQEEIDEDGNVKSVKINNKVQKIDEKVEEKHLKQNEPLILKEQNQNSDKTEEIDSQDGNQLSELLQDMGLVPLKKSNEINIDQDKLLDKIDELKIDANDKFKLKQICVEGYKSLQDQSFEKTGNDDDQDAEKTDEEIISNLVVENNLQHLLSTDDADKSRKKGVEGNQLALDGNELLELELIADKFDDINNSMMHADDEEWDFEFDDEGEEHDDDDDEEEDFSDDLLYGNSGATFIPQNEFSSGAQNFNNLLWKQVMDLRNKKAQAQTSNYNPANSRTKKSVRFSEKLEINEIENVSEELKNIDHFRQNISRFKQDRLSKSNDNEIQDVIMLLEKSKSNNFESPVNDIVERGPVSDIVEKDEPVSGIVGTDEPVNVIVERGPVSDIVERNGPVSDIVERGPVSDIVERNGPVSDIVERNGPVSDIVERNETVRDIVEREPVSDIIEREPISDIIVRNEPVSDIIERDPISDIVEEPISKVHLDEMNKSTDAPDTNKPRISKFKQMKATSAPQQSPKPPIKTHIKSFEITDIEQGRTRKAAIEESIKETEDNPMHIMDTTLDYNSMQDDMDTMVKAYALGMYDDDIMTEGPVVEQLGDFETLNKIIESMPNREVSTAKSVESTNENAEETFDPYLDQVGGEYQDDDDDDDDAPVLGDIMENDIVPPPDIEQTILDQEVTSNYHRLRQKLFFTNNTYQQDNNEFEPIDEHGNNLRISKFKASKHTLKHR